MIFTIVYNWFTNKKCLLKLTTKVPVCSNVHPRTLPYCIYGVQGGYIIVIISFFYNFTIELYLYLVIFNIKAIDLYSWDFIIFSLFSVFCHSILVFFLLLHHECLFYWMLMADDGKKWQNGAVHSRGRCILSLSTENIELSMCGLVYQQCDCYCYWQLNGWNRHLTC